MHFLEPKNHKNGNIYQKWPKIGIFRDKNSQHHSLYTIDSANSGSPGNFSSMYTLSYL